MQLSLLLLIFIIVGDILMLRDSLTLEELKVLIKKTDSYKEACLESNFKFKCNIYTEKVFAEIKDRTQSIRVSVSKGEHHFILSHTKDHGTIIVDPTYSQDLKSVESDDYPFFIGSREQLWKLADEDYKDREWFDKNWPVEALVMYPEDIYNEQMKSLFNTDGLLPVRIDGHDSKNSNMDAKKADINSSHHASLFSQNQTQLNNQKDKKVKNKKDRKEKDKKDKINKMDKMDKKAKNKNDSEEKTSKSCFGFGSKK